jgi:hypothetical protein
MRQYTKDGIIFDENHPARPKKKDGSPYINIPAKVKKEMIAAGTWPVLYTSVTEYLRVLSSQHLIDWALGIGVKATLSECDKSAHEEEDRGVILPTEEDCLKAARALRNEPADKGTDIHAVLAHAIKAIHNPQIGFAPQDQVQAACAASLKGWLEQTGLIKRVEAGAFRSESGFAIEIDGMRYGGTKDLVIDDLVIDFKTTERKRTPYDGELGQIAAYVRSEGAFDTHKGIELYFSRATGELLLEHSWLESDLALGWDIFKTCYQVAELQQRFKEEIG